MLHRPERDFQLRTRTAGLPARRYWLGFCIRFTILSLALILILLFSLSH